MLYFLDLYALHFGVMLGFISFIDPCNTMGELTWVFRVWSQLLQIARVATYFSFIQQMERAKRTGKTFRDVFLSSRGRLWKRKVLEPFSSVVYLRALSLFLDHLLCLKMCFVVWVWKHFKKTTLCVRSYREENHYEV